MAHFTIHLDTRSYEELESGVPTTQWRTFYEEWKFYLDSCNVQRVFNFENLTFKYWRTLRSKYLSEKMAKKWIPKMNFMADQLTTARAQRWRSSAMSGDERSRASSVVSIVEMLADVQAPSGPQSSSHFPPRSLPLAELPPSRRPTGAASFSTTPNSTLSRVYGEDVQFGSPSQQQLDELPNNWYDAEAPSTSAVQPLVSSQPFEGALINAQLLQSITIAHKSLKERQAVLAQKREELRNEEEDVTRCQEILDGYLKQLIG